MKIIETQKKINVIVFGILVNSIILLTLLMELL